MMYEIFEKLLKVNGITAYRVAKDTGISTATLSDWKKGRSTPKQDKLQKIANYFGVSVEYLMVGEDVTKDKIEQMTQIPVLGVVKAGIPMTAVENILGYEEIPYQMAQTGEFFALQVRGDSMEPKFSPGDVVIVRKQDDVECGDIAIFLINGNDATIKKIKKYEEDGIALVPLNPAYPVKRYSNMEIESLPVTILGKVVELRAKF